MPPGRGRADDFLTVRGLLDWLERSRALSDVVRMRSRSLRVDLNLGYEEERACFG